MQEIERRLGQLKLQQPRFPVSTADEVDARVEQILEWNPGEHAPTHGKFIRAGNARGDLLCGEERGGGTRSQGQQRSLAERVTEGARDVDQRSLATAVDAGQVGLDQYAAPGGEQRAHVPEYLPVSCARVAPCIARACADGRLHDELGAVVPREELLKLCLRIRPRLDELAGDDG